MKLFYSPGACSLAPHILLIEAGLPFTLERVHLSSHTYSGGNFRDINPKGYVPFLILDDGQSVSEVSVVLQFIADQVPEKNLIPRWGKFERYQSMSWLNYISTELHKNFSPLFNRETSEEIKSSARRRIQERLKLIESQIREDRFLESPQFSASDAYLFTILRWCPYTGVSLEEFPKIQNYFSRLKNHPSIQKAMETEGVKK